jgi:hypothetical protein
MLGGNVQDGSENNRRPSRCTYQQSTNPLAISIYHTLFRLLSIGVEHVEIFLKKFHREVP